jgi:hypothetical protein
MKSMIRHAHPSQKWLPAPALRSRDLRAGRKPPAAAERAKGLIGKFSSFLVIFLTLWTPLLVAQDQTDAKPRKPGSGLIDYLLNYLNMAGTKNSNEFLPMTQAERNRLYFKTMVNPLSFAKSGLSAGIDQANDKPKEWEQGASGYGRRFANILGQNSIQRTVSYGLGSALHEDNRYFNSGRQGFWPRTGYALTSGILARHDDGSRHFSISQVGGVASGAFLARVWLPPSQTSAGAGAVSFGITMGSNAAFGIVKEFLPDLGRALAKNHKKPATSSGDNAPRSVVPRAFLYDHRPARRLDAHQERSTKPATTAD